MSGCVESIASGLNMAKYAMDRIKEGAESRILDHAGTISRIDMVAVGKALAEDDPLAIEVIERGAEYLAGCSNPFIRFLTSTYLYTAAGSQSWASASFRALSPPIAAIRRWNTAYPAQFLPAELGDNAGMIGAALLVK